MTLKGKLYGVGVGSGDPELLTLKAVRLLQECGVVAATDSERTVYKTTQQVAERKPILFCRLPMPRNRPWQSVSV